jgi:hypothetical protein
MVPSTRAELLKEDIINWKRRPDCKVAYHRLLCSLRKCGHQGPHRSSDCRYELPPLHNHHRISKLGEPLENEDNSIARVDSVWVKLRRTLCEHMFSALPLNADILPSARGMFRQGPDADERIAAKTDQFGIAVTTSNFHAPLRPLWKNDLEQHL